MAEFQIIGKPCERLDGPEKVTGRAVYVGDLVLPGMVIGKVLRSPYPHARILNIDTSKADRLIGVKAVVTAEDTPKKKWGFIIKDMYPLALYKVRYVGEEVAAVAAIDKDTAEEALNLIEVEYEQLPAVFDPLEAMEEGAPQIHDEFPGNVASNISYERGSVAEGFAKADMVMEENFETSYQYHAPLETTGTVAYFSPDGRITLWTNDQGIHMAQEQIAVALDMPQSKIRVIQPYVGGAFGGKTFDDNNAAVAAFLAIKAGVPVKLINTREEEFMASRPRMPIRTRLKMGFTSDGFITAKQAYSVGDNGAYTGKALPVLGTSLRRVDHLYRHKNVKNEGCLVFTNKIPTSSMRGFGNAQGHFAVESMMDMAAHKLGIDPLEIRLRNGVEAGDTTVHGSRFFSCGLKESLKNVTDMSHWAEKKKDRKRNRGIGLACYIHVSGKRHFADWDGSSAFVKINEEGDVLVIIGEGEIGQGMKTALAQITGESLGISLDRIRVTEADTEFTPYCHGAHASRGVYIAGNAVKKAAEAAKNQLLETAAAILECKKDDIDIRDGQIHYKGKEEKVMSVAEVSKRCLFRQGGFPVVGFGVWDAPSGVEDKVRYGNESGAYAFGAHVAEVEVDPETGKVTILNYYETNDSGTIINPSLITGQVQGGLIQGLGFAMRESIQIEEGQVINPGFWDYRLPGFEDIPPLKMTFVETNDPTGPFGAKGVGEGVTVPIPAAIANAISDAIGIRFTHLPITADKIWCKLQEGKKK